MNSAIGPRIPIANAPTATGSRSERERGRATPASNAASALPPTNVSAKAAVKTTISHHPAAIADSLPATTPPIPERISSTQAARTRFTSEPCAASAGWSTLSLRVGPQRDTIVIGDPAPPTAPICGYQLAIGDRVVVALRDVTDIGLLSSAIWYLLPDGTVGTLAPEPPAATQAELFDYLRLLPDTSVPTEPAARSPLATLGAAFLAASGFAIARRLRRGT